MSDSEEARAAQTSAGIGTVVACEVRQPHQQTLAMRLETPAAAQYANQLLANARSGWYVVRGCSECAFGKVAGCWRCGSR